MIRAARGMLVTSVLAGWAVVAFSSRASAQTPGNMGPPQGGTLGEEEPKQEGNAEKAPKEAGQIPTLPPLPPYPNQEKKRFELFEMDGYFRFRTSWFDDFSLGYHDVGQGIPFRQSLTCRDNTPNTNANPVASHGCSGSLGSANLRLRLEPTIHLSETVSIHIQADLLDNLVLGSTANGTYFDGTSTDPAVPAANFSNGQNPPEGGKNSPWDSIRIKEAYGVVKSQLGELRFGRMPDQFGMGILHNAGGNDWIHGTTCLDCDYGDHVDRIMFGTTIPGMPIRAALGYTWVSSGPTAGQLDVWKNRVDGQPYDLDDSDDVTEWDLMLTHIDDPSVWKQQLDEGKLAINYGGYLAYRTQDNEALLVPLGSATPETQYIGRHVTEYVPDLWARLAYHKLTLEGELVAALGTIDNLSTAAAMNNIIAPQQSMQMFGGVLRLGYLMLNDDLDLQFEIGFASGDQWESKTAGAVNIHDANYYPQDPTADTISAFHFNPDYHVDLILWREIYGAVINATYVKPSFSYNITDHIRMSGAGIMSFANRPVATPGNASIYGVELDGFLDYVNANEGFFAGIGYGAFFPLGAMDHPSDLFPSPETVNTASTAQTFQIRLVLKY